MQDYKQTNPGEPFLPKFSGKQLPIAYCSFQWNMVPGGGLKYRAAVQDPVLGRAPLLLAGGGERAGGKAELQVEAGVLRYQVPSHCCN